MSHLVFDDRVCALGEGPLWHPERRQFYWFDILGQRLMTRDAEGPKAFQYPEPVSAAGWIDRDSLLMASASGLWRVDLRDGGRDLLHPLEADNPATRSNDGRADPWGGFWIGTMGRAAEPGAGAIYRYVNGGITKLFGGITIPNAICFSPDRARAFFADTAKGQVMAVALDEAGWPRGEPSILIDLTAEGLNPDGAVVDCDEALWIAQWGAGRVARHAADGRFLGAVALPARHTSCPAFGGDDLATLLVTSATQGLSPETLAEIPGQGMTYCIEGVGKGLPEPRVIP